MATANRSILWFLITLFGALYILLLGTHRYVSWDVPFILMGVLSITLAWPHGLGWKVGLKADFPWVVYGSLIFWGCQILTNAHEEMKLSFWSMVLIVIVVSVLTLVRSGLRLPWMQTVQSPSMPIPPSAD